MHGLHTTGEELTMCTYFKCLMVGGMTEGEVIVKSHGRGYCEVDTLQSLDTSGLKPDAGGFFISASITMVPLRKQ